MEGRLVGSISGPPQLPHDHATIDIDGLPSHIGRCWGAQKRDEAGDFLVRGRTPQGDALQLPLPALAAAEDVHAGGVDGTRTDRIHGDAVARHLHGEGLRKALNAEIGGAIRRGVGDAPFTENR